MTDWSSLTPRVSAFFDRELTRTVRRRAQLKHSSALLLGRSMSELTTLSRAVPVMEKEDDESLLLPVTTLWPVHLAER